MKQLPITLIFTVLSSLATVAAHPHSWVSLTTDIVIDEQQRLTDIRQRWVFDPFYSALTLADLKTEFSGDLALGLELQGAMIIDNLVSSGYYSHLILPTGEDRLLPRPVEYRLSSVAAGGDDILVLEMSFRLSDTPSVTADGIGFSVYDPTYYVDMRHESADFVRLHNASAAECGFELNDAEPSDEQIEYASSLDKTQTETVGLGQYFAQQVEVVCL